MTATDQLITFLAGADMTRTRREYGPLERLGEAWQAPALAIRVNPVWRAAAQPGRAFTPSRFCGPVRPA